MSTSSVGWGVGRVTENIWTCMVSDGGWNQTAGYRDSKAGTHFVALQKSSQKDSSHFCPTPDTFKSIWQSFFSRSFHLPVWLSADTSGFDSWVIQGEAKGLLALQEPRADWRRQKYHLSLQKGRAGCEWTKGNCKTLTASSSKGQDSETLTEKSRLVLEKASMAFSDSTDKKTNLIDRFQAFAVWLARQWRTSSSKHRDRSGSEVAPVMWHLLRRLHTAMQYSSESKLLRLPAQPP